MKKCKTCNNEVSTDKARYCAECQYRKLRECQKAYRHTEKGRAVMYASQARYAQTAKGKARDERSKAKRRVKPYGCLTEGCKNALPTPQSNYCQPCRDRKYQERLASPEYRQYQAEYRKRKKSE